MSPRFVALTLLLVPLGCSTFRPRALADGSYRLQCSSTYAQCVNRARKWCDGEELRLIKSSNADVFGTDGNQTGTDGALVIFRCGHTGIAEWKLPPRKGGAAPAGSASAKPAPPKPKPKASAEPPAPERACTPGVTQRCFGPGACPGAQACLPDGSGFGPCDCGSGNADAGAATDADAGTPADAGDAS